MTDRAHFYKPVIDTAGNVVHDINVALLEPGTETSISVDVFTGATGTNTFGATFDVPSGIINFYLALPKRVRIRVTPVAGPPVYFDNIDVTSPSQPSADLVTFAPAGTIGAMTVQAAIEESTTEGLAALATHSGAADPHPQYETSAEAAAKVTAHEAATDPHPIYLTQTEGDARYTQTTVSSVRTIDEEGVALTQRPTLNFVGRRVTATDDAGNNRTNITVAQPFSKKTANYTLVASTDDVVFFAGTNLTATLPDATTVTGVQFTVKNQDVSTLTVATAGGTIDGSATSVLAQYGSITVVSDGTNWGVI